MRMAAQRLIPTRHSSRPLQEKASAHEAKSADAVETRRLSRKSAGTATAIHGTTRAIDSEAWATRAPRSLSPCGADETMRWFCGTRPPPPQSPRSGGKRRRFVRRPRGNRPECRHTRRTWPVNERASPVASFGRIVENWSTLWRTLSCVLVLPHCLLCVHPFAFFSPQSL